jgi:ketosteroid isomerase-like protein
MEATRLDTRGERIRAAWNSQDVERVLETYAEEFRYTDPDTRGEITDRDGLRRYLTKLFAAMTAHTTVRASFLMAGSAGVTVLWRAAVRRAGEKEEVELEGADLIFFDGEEIASHEIYFDRARLAPLFAAVES